jgi:hypothetical protein
MGMYKELYQVICDYVGYDEGCLCYECTPELHNDVPTSAPDDCADPVLFDNIVDECTRHIKGIMPLDKLSSDARYCLNEWEEVMAGIDGPRDN